MLSGRSVALIITLLVGAVSEESPFSSSLVRAFDAGLVRVMQSGEWETIVSRYSKMFAASWTCSPDPTQYPFPIYSSLTTADALKVVLDRGSLRVGGFSANWGSDGDYTASPPTGFWPDLLEAVVSKIRTAYNKNSAEFQIQRVYLSTSKEILQNLGDGVEAQPEHQLDMTEPYMFVSSFVTDPDDGRNYFRHERFQMSCAIGSAEHAGFTRKDSGIYTQLGLNDYIAKQDQKTLVGTLTKGNFQQYKPILNGNAVGSYTTEVPVLDDDQKSTLMGKLDDHLEVFNQFDFQGLTILRNWTLTIVESGDATHQVTTKSEVADITFDYSTGVKFIFDHYVDTDHVIEAVIRGDITVGIVSALSSVYQNKDLNAFQMSLLSPQAALFRKDKPKDICPRNDFVPREMQACKGDVEVPVNALSSTLVRAFDAGLVRVIQSGEWEDIVAKYSKMFAASWTCSPDPESYPFPDESQLKSHDALYKVLESGVLRVAGFQADWGSDGNYKADPPTGFWPDLLSATIAKIRTAYNKNEETLQVKRVFLDTSSAILTALKHGVAAPEESRADMTEPYMFVSSFFRDPEDGQNYFRHERFQMSCAIGSAEHTGFTEKSSGIYTQRGLNDYIAIQDQGTLVGTLTKGNFQQYQPILNAKAVGSYTTDVDVGTASEIEILKGHLSDVLVATEEFVVFGTTILKDWALVSVQSPTGSVAQQVATKAELDGLALDYEAGVRLTFDHFVDTDHLVEAVIRGDVKAGIVSALQSIYQNNKLNAFQMSLLSPQAALFRKDEPEDICPANDFVSKAKASSTCPPSSEDTDASFAWRASAVVAVGLAVPLGAVASYRLD